MAEVLESRNEKGLIHISNAIAIFSKLIKYVEIKGKTTIKGDKWSRCKKKANKIKKDTTIMEKRKEIRETVKIFWDSDEVIFKFTTVHLAAQLIFF